MATPSAFRVRDRSPTRAEVLVEEERSRDGETGHVAETLGYLVLPANEP